MKQEFELNPLSPAEIEIVAKREIIRRPLPTWRPKPLTGLPCVNTSGEVIPAHGCLQPDGWELAEDDQFLLKVIKPNDRPSDVYYLNGPFDVGKDETFRCAEWPAVALWGPTTGQPQPNQVVGPKAGEWKLYNQQPGFVTLSRLNASNPKRMLVKPIQLQAYAALSGSGQIQTGGSGYTKLTVLTTSHVAAFGISVSEANHTFTMIRDGAYHCEFTGCGRFVSWAGAAPLITIFKNGAGLTPTASCQAELNNVNYRQMAFNAHARLSAGDVIDVRLNGPSGQDLRFQYCQFTMQLIGLA
jgi:hypothetical protein